MSKYLLTTALLLLATPSLAKEYSVKEISDPSNDVPDYFSPDTLTIQPGDTVTFVNDQDDKHEVMFINVPKGVNEMIMGPMQRKKGETWSYTFTIPGTYKFHCHPHERVGMEGTLIVGKASKVGETKAMDHHKMAQRLELLPISTTPTDQPQGTGKLNSVDAAAHNLTITHEAIAALGWPKMRMTFPVDPKLDLSGFASGDNVAFTLHPEDADTYTIVRLDHVHSN